MTKEEIKEKEQKLLELTSAFCREHLNEEYQALCEKLIKKLSRKRNVPYQTGKIEFWAGAIVYTIGSISFLFDRSSEPYLAAENISAYFKASHSTVSNKARDIKKMCKIDRYDPDFSTKSARDSDPWNNFVMVNGFIRTVSSLPPEIQEMVKEARENGDDIIFTS